MTENKRYFKRMWEEEYYIFDSKTISEKEFDEKVEYEDYQAFADSMAGDDVVNRLNELHEENQQLQSRINDYDVALKTLQDLSERKLKENKQLKEQIADLENSFDICKHYKETYGDEIVHIKQTIKTMTENERTELGRSVLKQLWEAIQ